MEHMKIISQSPAFRKPYLLVASMEILYQGKLNWSGI